MKKINRQNLVLNLICLFFVLSTLITCHGSSYYSKGSKRLAISGETEKAIKYAFIALKKNPKDILEYCSIGSLYNELRDPENALKYLNKYVELSPKTPEYEFCDEVVYLDLGIAYAYKGDSNVAVQNFNKFLTTKNQLAESLKNKIADLIKSLEENPGKHVDAFGYLFEVGRPWP